MESLELRKLELGSIRAMRYLFVLIGKVKFRMLGTEVIASFS
ncbi:hypothetical protein [Bacillus sp. AFS015802]|nr:hypothetical protein [Bacillus sp. AFS015802]